MTRKELQAIAAQRLAKSHRLLCQWCTGTGKSGVALEFIRANSWMKCLILVPEQNNIQNWLDEFKKFGVSSENVTVICYASFHKYANTQWDLLVIDEAPHLDTDRRRAISRTVKADYVLALGAVIDEEERIALESVYGRFDVSYIPLKKAIEWNILPIPTVHVIHLHLDNEVPAYTHRKRKVTAKVYYDSVKQKVDSAVMAYNSVPSEFNKRIMLRAGAERKRVLGNIKDHELSRMCHNLERNGKRFICFCVSIKQAEALGGSHAYTSKTPVSQKLLEKFNAGEINSLYVVGKLIEGQNLNNIECGIIGQLGGTSRITVQEIGRILRSENPEIYIPVIDGTKDDSFLYTLTSNIPEDYIKHYNY